MNRCRTLLIIPALSILTLVSLLQGCTKKETPVVKQMEKPVDPATVKNVEPKRETPEKLPPATMQEVQAAVQRNFGDDVVISSRFQPVFLVGDFNGDEMEDLAVMVEPADAKLSDINSELANWIIQDADQYFIPAPNAHVVKSPEMHRPQIEKGETVLAVIHGYGARAWRDPKAHQTYLVKHAAAAFQGISKSFKEKYIRSLRLPVRSDIIKASRDSKRGFLFWTGSSYAWHANNG